LSLKWNLNGLPATESEVIKKSGMPILVDMTHSLLKPPRKTTICPYCNTKEFDLTDNARVGCPLCYVVFETLIQNWLTLEQ